MSNLTKYVAILAVIVALTLGACGDDNTRADENVFPITKPPPSREIVRSWPDKWCDVELGMTRNEVIKVMGTPTDDQPESLEWAAYEYMFIAFFKADGTIGQLDIDSGFAPCDTTRGSL